MLDVGTVRNHLSVLHDAIADAPLRMIQGQDKNPGVRNSEGSFNEIDILTRAGQLRHVYREVGVRHHARQRVHDEICITAACKIKREMVSWIVERTKERNPLNVVEVEMAEENVRADRLVAELLLQLTSEQANACAAIENEDLVRVGSNLNT